MAPHKRVEPTGEGSEIDESPRGAGTQRIPFGGLVRKLYIPNKDPNYFYYWQKDAGDNIKRMLQAGYEFVDSKTAGVEVPEMLADAEGMERSDLDGTLRVHGGVGEGGRDYGMVAMRIPKELHEEDMRALDARADAIDTAIQRQAFDGKQGMDSATSYGSVDMKHRNTE